jgi:hypothetical protein
VQGQWPFTGVRPPNALQHDAVAPQSLEPPLDRGGRADAAVAKVVSGDRICLLLAISDLEKEITILGGLEKWQMAPLEGA